MANKKYSLGDLILDNLLNLRGLLSPYGVGYKLAMEQRRISKSEFGQTLVRMSRRRLIRFSEKNNEKFIALTKAGQLEALLLKAKIEKQKVWDGKWRLFMFDIPERSKEKRNRLRSLLKSNNFFKLQASVYISPYALNREAIDYLNQSGLRDYVRILKVQEMDSDTELLKRFNLHKSHYLTAVK